jgi:hypothetical protein
MEEKVKIVGKGLLYGMKMGSSFKLEDIEEKSKNIHYDNKIDQYRYKDQWMIPFHKYEDKK